MNTYSLRLHFFSKQYSTLKSLCKGLKSSRLAIVEIHLLKSPSESCIRSHQLAPLG